jgi:ABC-type multidrug transport system ATPase subunit
VRALVGGFIEQPGFHDNRSGPRNLQMLAALQGIARPERMAEVARVLDLVGLSGVHGKRVGHYSQGMRQRLGLAQALLGQPRYLVLDEPTNGLDPQGIHELRVLLQELAATSGATILLSSHLLTEVGELVDRLVLLSEGHLRFSGTPAELVDGQQTTVLQVANAGLALERLAERGIEVRSLEEGAATEGELEITRGDIRLEEALELLGPGELLGFHRRRPTHEQALLARLLKERDS